jgi:hypothetical protein
VENPTNNQVRQLAPKGTPASTSSETIFDIDSTVLPMTISDALFDYVNRPLRVRGKFRFLSPLRDGRQESAKPSAPSPTVYKSQAIGATGDYCTAVLKRLQHVGRFGGTSVQISAGSRFCGPGSVGNGGLGKRSNQIRLPHPYWIVQLGLYSEPVWHQNGRRGFEGASIAGAQRLFTEVRRWLFSPRSITARIA